jgi:hypothetical protein
MMMLTSPFSLNLFLVLYKNLSLNLELQTKRERNKKIMMKIVVKPSLEICEQTKKEKKHFLAFQEQKFIINK